MSDLPYRAEYAKSARSLCKSCRVNIEKDHLRIAVLVQVNLMSSNDKYFNERLIQIMKTTGRKSGFDAFALRIIEIIPP